MTHATVDAMKAFSLALLCVAGIVLLLLWVKRSLRPLTLEAEARAARTGHVSPEALALRVFFSMLPYLALFIVVCVPLFFFNHLSNQHDVCIDIIQINHLKKGDPFLVERCGRLDQDELIRLANEPASP